MLVKILKGFLIVALVCSFTSFSTKIVQAKTPEEECGHAEEAGLTCKVCGDCAVIFTRVGEKLCKQCSEYECNLTECDKCSEPDYTKE